MTVRPPAAASEPTMSNGRGFKTQDKRGGDVEQTHVLAPVFGLVWTEGSPPTSDPCWKAALH